MSHLKRWVKKTREVAIWNGDGGWESLPLDLVLAPMEAGPPPGDLKPLRGMV